MGSQVIAKSEECFHPPVSISENSCHLKKIILILVTSKIIDSHDWNNILYDEYKLLNNINGRFLDVESNIMIKNTISLNMI